MPIVRARNVNVDPCKRLHFLAPPGIKRPLESLFFVPALRNECSREDVIGAYTLVAVLTIGGLLSFPSAADARRQVRRTIGDTPRPGMNIRARGLASIEQIGSHRPVVNPFPTRLSST